MRRRRKHTQLEDSKKCAHKTNGFGVGTISTSGVFAGNVPIEIVTIELGNLSSIKHTINCHPGRVHALHITKKQTIEPFVRTIKIIKVGLESGRRRDATDMAATMAYAGFKSGMCNRSLLHVQVSMSATPVVPLREANASGPRGSRASLAGPGPKTRPSVASHKSTARKSIHPIPTSHYI